MSPKGIPVMPEGFISPAQAAERCGQILPNGKPNVQYIWARMDPSHSDMIPHYVGGTAARKLYRIRIDEFDAWDAAHKVEKQP